MKSFILASCTAAALAETIGDINFTSLGEFFTETLSPYDLLISQWQDKNSISEPFALLRTGSLA